jgi:hypothetical protein
VNQCPAFEFPWNTHLGLGPKDAWRRDNGRASCFPSLAQRELRNASHPRTLNAMTSPRKWPGILPPVSSFSSKDLHVHCSRRNLTNAALFFRR